MCENDAAEAASCGCRAARSAIPRCSSSACCAGSVRSRSSALVRPKPSVIELPPWFENVSVLQAAVEVDRRPLPAGLELVHELDDERRSQRSPIPSCGTTY